VAFQRKKPGAIGVKAPFPGAFPHTYQNACLGWGPVPSPGRLIATSLERKIRS
jgi:hypothetical protein